MTPTRYPCRRSRARTPAERPPSRRACPGKPLRYAARGGVTDVPLRRRRRPLTAAAQRSLQRLRPWHLLGVGKKFSSKATRRRLRNRRPPSENSLRTESLFEGQLVDVIGQVLDAHHIPDSEKEFGNAAVLVKPGTQGPVMTCMLGRDPLPKVGGVATFRGMKAIRPHGVQPTKISDERTLGYQTTCGVEQWTRKSARHWFQPSGKCFKCRLWKGSASAHLTS